MFKKKSTKIFLIITLFVGFFASEILAQTNKNITKNLEKGKTANKNLTSFNKIKEIKFVSTNKLEILFTEKSFAGKNNSEKNFKIFTLENPNRLVIDIIGGEFYNKNYKPILPFFATSFRSRKHQNSLRLVFDLSQKIFLQNSKLDLINKKITAEISGVISTKSEKIDNKKNTKTDLDFIDKKVAEFEVETTKIDNPDGTAKFVVRKTPIISEQNSATKLIPNKKIPVIVIDAGHGGKDPGTIGTFARTKEKNLTLSYAKELGKQLVNSGRYKVYLTRDEDIFIPLRLRVQKARNKKADLFISIHINAISDGDVSGFSIYTLSENSSDKQAELLAQKENRADIINGMDFSQASADIIKTLIDLSQRESKNESARFAIDVINSVKKSEIEILQNSHRFAGFAVLTAPDMASVLVELGYLSNKKEEELLNSLGYKRKVAISLVKAIDEYFLRKKI
jgi:N-acetylmuramoyl-L-alanine amidase